MDNDLEKTKPISLEELTQLDKELSEENSTSEESTIEVSDEELTPNFETDATELNEDNISEEHIEAENNSELEPKKKKPKKALIIVLVVLGALVLLGFMLFMVFFGWKLIFKRDKKANNEEKNVIVEVENYRFQNGKLIFLDGKDEIGSYNCENNNAKNCYLADFNNTEDNFFISQQVYEDLSIVPVKSRFIANQYAFIVDTKSTKDAKINIYDFKNKKKIDTVDKIKYYNVDGKVIVQKNGKYGIYNLDSKDQSLVVPYEYDYLGVITENKETNNAVVAKKDNDWFLISYDNKEVSKPLKTPIMEYNSEYIVSGTSENYMVYDYKGNLTISGTYSYIKLLDEYLLVVDDLSLMVKDYENNNYSEDAIKLTSKEYITKYVYDSKGIRLKVQGSFTAEYVDNTIKIQDLNNNKNYTINLMEGLVNRKYDYINYYNGYLYFYSDLEKTSLVGSYKCSNKNDIKDSESTFNNCYVGKDTAYEKNDVTNNEGKTGVIPVINNRYVFINDGNVIKMYDFSRSKVIGQYQNVCTYFFTDSESVSYESVNDLDIIARNNSNKMGLVRIVNGEVTKGIDFNYLSLEKIGKFYLAKNSNAKYQLIYTSDGTNQSKEFSGVIKGYNDDYLKIKENNKYYLYDYDGNKITSSGAKYIQLYDEFYFLVNDSNELTVYNYQNEQIISDNIKLYNSRYTDETKPAFKMELDGNTLTISVLSSEEYLAYHYDITTGTRVEG